MFEFQNNDPSPNPDRQLRHRVRHPADAGQCRPYGQDDLRRAGSRLPRATALLPDTEDETAAWVDDALADDAPFAFEQIAPQGTRPAPTEPLSDDIVTPAPPPAPPPKPERPKQRIVDAAEDCIAAYSKEGGWDTDSIKQVRTAIRLFDHACGGDAFIEDLDQSHVRAFTTLCRALPNRWGRTREEQAGGIAASLERAKGMDPAQIGISQVTINKHLTWVAAVLAHAAGEEDDPKAHRPAKPLSFKVARAGLANPIASSASVTGTSAPMDQAGSRHAVVRADLDGCAGIGGRFKPGTEIFHDAWYWLPLMLPLYGGRSSELAGLGLAEVFEQDPIPYFLIQYTEDRSLKNIQSIRRLPIHPELIRLGFIDYVKAMRAAGSTMLFPEMQSPNSTTFAGTFYKSCSGRCGTGLSRRHVMAASRRRGMEGQGRPQLPRLGQRRP